MPKVLDLDLDFFVYPVVRGSVNARPRPSHVDNPCASVDQVGEYLERNCGLSRSKKLPGRFCKRHDGAFYAWKKWLAKGTLGKPFEVAHLDGHSDLSFGDDSSGYVLKTTLALPLDQRSRPPRKIDCMNEGSYLTFAIANRWVERLSYAYPVCLWSDFERRRNEAFNEIPRDLSCVLFKDQKPESGAIQLRHLDKRGYGNAVGGGSVTPIAVEPEVPFTWSPANRFSQTGFTHMILAHSKKYCPPEADNLISVIREYFYDAY